MAYSRSIRVQIIVVTLSSFFLAGAIGVLSLFKMNEIRTDIHKVAQTYFPLIEIFAEMEIIELNQGIIVERFYRQIENGRFVQPNEIEKQLDDLSHQLNTLLSSGKDIIRQTLKSVLPPFTADVFASIRDQFLSYEKLHVEFNDLIHKSFILIDAGRTDDALLLFMELERREMDLVRIQDQMLHVMERLTEETIREAEQKEDQGIITLFIAMVAGLFLSIILSHRLAKSVIKPLTQATDIADKISENHLDISVPPAQTVEMEKMFAALKHMIDSIQEQRRLEHMLMVSEKMSSIGRLATGVAHEINNPLASATMGIQNLKTLQIRELNPDAEIILDSIEKGLDRAAIIAQELLVFSRDDVSNLMPVNLQDVLEGALTIVGHRFKHVRLKQEWRNMLPEICGDPIKLEQAFINILTNAVDATSQDGRIEITGSCDDEDVIVKVADSGSGIREEIFPKIFDPFFTTKEIGDGTGLGLSICYNIVVKYGGTIEIDSVVNQGTLVTVRFPMKGHEC